MRGIAVAAAAAALTLAAPAWARWIHTKGNDDPFKGGAEHIVLAADFDGFAAGFRCTSNDDLVLLFIAPEKPDPDHSAVLGILPMKLLVVVDDESKISLTATLETTPDGSNYRLVSDDEKVAGIAHSVAKAKRRFALAGEINGNLAWSKSFSVSGSRRAMQPLISGCRLPG